MGSFHREIGVLVARGRRWKVLNGARPWAGVDGVPEARGVGARGGLVQCAQIEAKQAVCQRPAGGHWRRSRRRNRRGGRAWRRRGDWRYRVGGRGGVVLGQTGRSMHARARGCRQDSVTDVTAAPSSTQLEHAKCDDVSGCKKSVRGLAEQRQADASSRRALVIFLGAGCGCLTRAMQVWSQSCSRESAVSGSFFLLVRRNSLAYCRGRPFFCVIWPSSARGIHHRWLVCCQKRAHALWPCVSCA